MIKQIDHQIEGNNHHRKNATVVLETNFTQLLPKEICGSHLGEYLWSLIWR